MRFLLVVSFIIIHFSSFGITLGDSEKKLIKTARKHFLYGEYEKAIDKYEQAIAINSESAELYFELGLCHYEGDLKKENALPFFQQALKKSTKDTIPELLYYLAQAYQYNQEFTDAIYYYKLFDKKLSPSKEGKELKSEANNLVTMCKNGEVLLSSFNDKIKVENLGAVINSDFSEYAPVINKEGNLLVFTARKKGNTGDKLFHDDKYFEDIYYSKLVDTTWSLPMKLDQNSQITSTQLNFVYHDAAIAFNQDESALYIYRQNDIWKAPIINNKISEAEPLSDVINTSEHEPSVFLTPDGNTLYLVSNKEGGFGGRDLYYSKKQSDGSWSEVKNMGEKINTPFDDDAPFISSEGKTLYFSSKGHNSMGGYDIFSSTLDESNEWSQPVNLGLPINSPGDDIYFIEDGKGIGYFSSDRVGGIGSMDIYRIVSRTKETNNDSLVANLDSLENIKTDSVISIPNTIASTSSFEMNYEYNVFGINHENVKYQKFLQELLAIAKINGKIILELEASASKVPTTTYKSNHNLAKIRLNEAADILQKDLLKLGLKKEQIHITTFNATVQGPDYKDDFETNKSTYQKYQYFKATAK